MLKPEELKVLVGLLAIGLTAGAMLVVVVFAIACAMSGMSGLNETESDEGLDDIQRELDLWREGPAVDEQRTPARLHAPSRERRPTRER